jgi:hypothetical protein
VPPVAAAVPAAPAPSNAPTAASVASAEEGWSRLRVRLQERPALAAALDHAEVGAWEPGRVTLLFADKLLLERAEKNRKPIEDALAAVTGGPTALVLKPGGGGMSAVVRAETAKQADAVADDRRRREQEARQHPVIRKAQELFGVAPREIKVP